MNFLHNNNRFHNKTNKTLQVINKRRIFMQNFRNMNEIK